MPLQRSTISTIQSFSSLSSVHRSTSINTTISRSSSQYICRQCRKLSNRPPQRLVHLPRDTRRSASSFATALASASNIVADATSTFTMNPASAVANEMKSLTSNIQALLSSGHPSLDKVAKYYVQSEGKHLRPLVVLLMARATSLAPKVEGGRRIEGKLKGVDVPISSQSILQDINPAMAPSYPSDILSANTTSIDETSLKGICSSQRRLAEITEMIHAASLLHDDVIDNAETRRGAPSGNLAFGNKMAILAGDFLLGRASVALARLRDAEVVELLATVIANLVEGEFMQLKNAQNHVPGKFTNETFEYYLQKTYLKSASLISKSCRAAALLGGSTKDVADAAYEYGKNLGLSFQLVDDMLDYTVSASELGKPSAADLKLGLATAPVLFAWEQYAELGPLMERKFAEEGDVERVYPPAKSQKFFLIDMLTSILSTH